MIGVVQYLARNRNMVECPLLSFVWANGLIFV